MTMRQCRDTFLHILADNLVDIPVHNLRVDPTIGDDGQYLQMNAVNVHFLNPDFGSAATASKQLVALDVVNDDELTALDWAEQVAYILHTGPYPKKDYTNPASPTTVGGNLWWDTYHVRFRPISTGNYYRLSALFTINHHIA